MSADLETFQTDELIEELRRRSVVFFCCMRPHDSREFDWKRSYGGEIDRVLGLIEVTKNDLLNPESREENKTT